eukprot:317519-Lingulodinium_polyedra.AAC.1
MDSSEDGKQPGMEDPVPWLKNRFSGEKTAPCPSKRGVKFGVVGPTWCIRDTSTVGAAKLEHVVEKEVFGLRKQFRSLRPDYACETKT